MLEKLDLRENTAAFAMLTKAYHLAGDEMEHFRRLPALVDMEPQSYADFLFKGWAEAVWLEVSNG